MTSDEAEEALASHDTGCSGDPSVWPAGLAVIEGRSGPVVAVAIGHGGLLLRGPDGGWRRVSQALLEVAPQTPPGDEGRGPLRRSGAVLPPASSSSPSPSPVCPSPTLTTVTPNPLNGPPTTYEVCA